MISTWQCDTIPKIMSVKIVKNAFLNTTELMQYFHHYICKNGITVTVFRMKACTACIFRLNLFDAVY